jgi:ferredoxin/flavodoxin---NADP+ reductase
MRETFPVKISQNIPISTSAWLLSFPRPYDFTPGQVLGIGLKKSDEPRLYSIASGNKNNDIWILYTVKVGGYLTPALSALKAGDTILITHPFGNFICREEKAVWVATGTGVAPFASMFFSDQYHNKTLIHGSRDNEGLYFSESFLKAMGPNYHPCCSRVPHQGCYSGRVISFLESRESIQTDIPYYLCGVAEMVVDVRDLLISRGVPYHQIMAEIFF